MEQHQPAGRASAPLPAIFYDHLQENSSPKPQTHSSVEQILEAALEFAERPRRACARARFYACSLMEKTLRNVGEVCHA
jgi:hypothetical protein